MVHHADWHAAVCAFMYGFVRICVCMFVPTHIQYVCARVKKELRERRDVKWLHDKCYGWLLQVRKGVCLYVCVCVCVCDVETEPVDCERLATQESLNT